MKYQQVTVDVWKMMVTAASYMALAFAAWVLLRLVSACISLPGHLRKQQEEEEEEERRLLAECASEEEGEGEPEQEQEEDAGGEPEAAAEGDAAAATATTAIVTTSVTPASPQARGRRRGGAPKAEQVDAAGAGAEHCPVPPAPTSPVRQVAAQPQAADAEEKKKKKKHSVHPGPLIDYQCPRPRGTGLRKLAMRPSIAASYRGPGSDEGPENYAARIAFTGNSRVLGPACLSVGLLMLLAGGALCLLARRARRRETRLAFHCPLHGDFYPLSPITAYGPQRRTHAKSWLCRWWGRSSKTEVETTTPKCPHSTVSSSRSSVSSAPPSPCPTPLPFLTTGFVALWSWFSKKIKSGSPSPPLSQQPQSSHVDELILATARRLELPPLVRQEVTLVSPGSLVMPTSSAKSSSGSILASGQAAGFVSSPSSASFPQTAEVRGSSGGARPTSATRKSVSILLPEKGHV
ncbi:hypothetical protein FOCC_FOCC004810 [Frankliniella occidentalis]|nr:hypothetical protein FOCC_FOCC004810 [Frankliniella occidentalis]